MSNWLDRIVPSIMRSANKNASSIPEGLWKKCPSCSGVLYRPELEKNQDVCPKCGHHLVLNARRRIDLFLDPEDRSEIAAHKAELDELSTKLVEQGLGIWSNGSAGDDSALILRGQANLLDDLQVADGLSEIRGLFDALEARENALRLLDATREGDGVKIFIGAENKLFASTGCSLVIAPYKNVNQSIIGAIGVIGPRHMNYARIIPMVDYTSKAIDRVLGH